MVLTAFTSVVALWLNVSAPPRPAPVKPGPHPVLVLAAAAQDSNEPAFVLLCTGPDGKFREPKLCKPPPGGTRVRRPREDEHTVGRPTLASPCELSKQRRPGVTLDPAPPRGPFLAVWPSADAMQLLPAGELTTRIPDVGALKMLGDAVGGTPVIDQSLVLDLDHDGKDDRLFAVRRQGVAGSARLVLIAGDAPEAWRLLPIPAAAQTVRLLAVSDLDHDKVAELFLFAQLDNGWELEAISASQEVPLGALTCPGNSR